jgi:DNA invertase Pin-like site-specific DNA recombinase
MGKSGLTVGGREALRQLLDDVQSDTADFEAILVYDVSRWGRFQDIDESGYYEHICKRAGIRVHYCAEQFVNDGSPFSVIIKNIKRVMAGEYSRELSAKVFAAHSRLAACGYFQGGPPGYGLRRLLIDGDGTGKLELRSGERKNIQTDRVLLVQGSAEETETVRWIFESFVRRRKKEPALARLLNRRGVPWLGGGLWSARTVRRVLKNERYIGNYLWNRHSKRLGKKPTRNSADQWIRTEDVIAPFVSRPYLRPRGKSWPSASRDRRWTNSWNRCACFCANTAACQRP